MHAQDHPNEFKFSRPGKLDPAVQEVTSKTAWADSLTGGALEEYMDDKMPSKQILDLLRNRLESGSVIALGPR